MPEKPSGEKTEQATPRRRQDARKRGTVAKSTDLTGALGLITVAIAAPAAFSGLAGTLLKSMGASVASPPNDLSYGSALRYGLALLLPPMAAVGPMILAVMVVGLASNFAQVGFVLSGEALNPTLDKLNPMTGIQRLFSVRSTFEGLKTIAKMVLFGMIAWGAVQSEWERLAHLSWYSPPQAATIVGGLAHTILIRVAMTWLVLAVADYIFQRRQVDKQLMMTKDELRRDFREQEGSPEVKSVQMQRRRKFAKGGLATKMQQADVLITNPTHFAVALKYDRSKMVAPQVLAKGADYLALRMRQLANDLDIPIVENKPLARALYKQCEAGDFVPRDLFAPVAEILAYVYQAVKRVRK